jgi:hypothetical protein
MIVTGWRVMTSQEVGEVERRQKAIYQIKGQIKNQQ